MAGEWVEVAVGDIANVVGGGTPSTADPSNFDGDVPWLTPKDLSGPHPRYVKRGNRNLSRKSLASCSAQILPTNSVMLSSRAPIGYVAIAANPIATNQGFRSLVLKPGYDHEFIYYWLIANVEELERHASGSTFKELSGGALKNIRLRLPADLNEQRAIAHILGTLDDRVDHNRALAAKLEAIARRLFKSWFVDFDPVRAKTAGEKPVGLADDIAALFPDRLVDSDLGEIPEGWSVTTLGDAFDLNPKRTLAKGTIAPYLDMANTPTTGHVPDQIIQRAFSSGSRFINGDTLLARITPCLENGKAAFVDFLGDKAVGWGSTEFIVMRPKAKLPEYFGYLLARYEPFKTHAIASMSGTSGRQRVQPDSLATWELVLPSEAVAMAFGQFVEPMRALIAAASEEIRVVRSIRDLLLPRLISGKLRVSEAEEAIAEAMA